ncbi:MAG TPA: hypothetical protein PK185_18360 [Cyclobacteriaceae bacterium]|nr:hypothetical protein [Cyclobacteriaceae bacterium]
MSDPTYIVQFNLYYADESGYNTGHSNVTVEKIDENGVVTKYVFGANSSGGNVGTWVNPYSKELDGIIGQDIEDWVPDNPTIPIGGVVSAEMSISETDYQKILDFMEPYTGNDYTGNFTTNYDVFASVNPMSPNGSWSCYSFSQHIYELGSTHTDKYVIQ